MPDIPFNIITEECNVEDAGIGLPFFIAAHNTGTISDPVIIARRIQNVNVLSSRKTSWPPFPNEDGISRGIGGTLSQAGGYWEQWLDDPPKYYSCRFQSAFELTGQASNPIYAAIEATNDDDDGQWGDSGDLINLQWFKGPYSPPTAWNSESNWGRDYWGDLLTPVSFQKHGPFIIDQTVIWPVNIETLNFNYPLDNCFFLADPYTTEPLIPYVLTEPMEYPYLMASILISSVVLKLYYLAEE